jgi:hypothetical protein
MITVRIKSPVWCSPDGSFIAEFKRNRATSEHHSPAVTRQKNLGWRVTLPITALAAAVTDR